MDVPNDVDPTSTEAVAAANTTDDDKPLRVLVHTQTHLVPGNKSTGFDERYQAMRSLICQHVWQREFDKFRERDWWYQCHFSKDNVECWFLVDHHGPDPTPPPDPPIVRYRWTGTEFITIHTPLPDELRYELQNYYWFERISHQRLTEGMPERPTPRVYKSLEEEEIVKTHMLLDTLLSNMRLGEENLRFVRKFPDGAEWVKAQVPPEAWARLDDPSERILPLYWEADDE